MCIEEYKEIIKLLKTYGFQEFDSSVLDIKDLVMTLKYEYKKEIIATIAIFEQDVIRITMDSNFTFSTLYMNYIDVTEYNLCPDTTNYYYLYLKIIQDLECAMKCLVKLPV